MKRKVDHRKLDHRPWLEFSTSLARYQIWHDQEKNSETLSVNFSRIYTKFSRAEIYYPFIADGCPVDEYTSLEPRLDLEDRFNTQTFKFQDSPFVYIQCDVIVCDLRVPNDPECQSTCRNDISRQTVQFHLRHNKGMDRAKKKP